MSLFDLLLGGGAALAGVVITALIFTFTLRSKKQDAAGLIEAAKKSADQVGSQARGEAEKAKTAAVVEGKMEALKLRDDVERDLARRREEADRAERRVDEREKTAVRRGEEVEKQAKAVASQQGALTQKELSIDGRLKEIDALAHEQRARLERIAGMTAEDARREFLQRIEDEARAQAAALARDIKEQAKKGDRKSVV